MSLREEHFFLHAEHRNSRLERKTRDLALFYTLGTAKRSHIKLFMYSTCGDLHGNCTKQIYAHFHNIPFLFCERFRILWEV